MFKRKNKGTTQYVQTLSKQKVAGYQLGGLERSYLDDLIGRLLIHHGQETQRMTREFLSRRWSPGLSAMRPFPAMRSGRLSDSIGYLVRRNGSGSTSLFSGILIKTDLARGQLPPSIWGRFHEYGHVVRMNNPSKPFFYVPTPGSPAMGSDGQIDRSWLPGMALREKLKRIGANVGARAFYFPMPKSLSAKKRVIMIAAIRWRNGKAEYVINPTPIAVGLREFTIPSRPYLRPAWDRMYNTRGDGRLNKDAALTAQEIEWIIRGGLRGNDLADYEKVLLTTVINLKV